MTKDDVFQLRIDSELKESFIKIAKKQSTNASDILERYIKGYVSDNRAFLNGDFDNMAEYISESKPGGLNIVFLPEFDSNKIWFEFMGDTVCLPKTLFDAHTEIIKRVYKYNIPYSAWQDEIVFVFWPENREKVGGALADLFSCLDEYFESRGRNSIELMSLDTFFEIDYGTAWIFGLTWSWKTAFVKALVAQAYQKNKQRMIVMDICWEYWIFAKDHPEIYSVVPINEHTCMEDLLECGRLNIVIDVECGQIEHVSRALQLVEEYTRIHRDTVVCFDETNRLSANELQASLIKIIDNSKIGIWRIFFTSFTRNALIGRSTGLEKLVKSMNIEILIPGRSQNASTNLSEVLGGKTISDSAQEFIEHSRLGDGLVLLGSSEFRIEFNAQW